MGAQQVHLEALRRGEGLFEPVVLRWRHPFPLSDIVQGVCIGDGLVAGIVHKQSSGMLFSTLVFQKIAEPGWFPIRAMLESEATGPHGHQLRLEPRGGLDQRRGLQKHCQCSRDETNGDEGAAKREFA